MKKLTKENKGITLVILIITIVIMLILTSVTIYTGLNSYKSMKVTEFITQMQLIQGKVDELKESKTMDELTLMGETVPTNKQIIINDAKSRGEITSSSSNSYRYFSAENIKQELDLVDGIDGEIMINFTTREVVSTTGVKYEDEIYYTQYLLPNGQKLFNNTNKANRDLSFDLNVAIEGLNATITINNIKIANGTLNYREQGNSYWQTITNYTEKGKEERALVSKSATYEFKLIDNVTREESAVVTEKIILTNRPKTTAQINSYNYSSISENWAYATDTGGKNYVWIPRFAYKNDEETNTIEIKFVKGNSNILTDNSIIDEESWTVSDKFNLEDGTKITGIWVSVETLNQTGLDMITILNDSTRATLTEITTANEQ